MCICSSGWRSWRGANDRREPAEPEGIPAKRFMPDPARRPSNAVPNLAVGLTSLQDDLAPIAPEIAALADEADAAPAGRLRAAVRKLLGAFGKRER